MQTFVMDLGFSSAKCLFGDKEFRMFSAYRDGTDMMVLGDEALRMTGASYLKTPEDLVRGGPGGRLFPVGLQNNLAVTTRNNLSLTIHNKLAIVKQNNLAKKERLRWLQHRHNVGSPTH